MAKLLTLGEAADRLGVQVHRLRRLFLKGLLTGERVGPNRVIPEGDLPKVRKALEDAGYLPTLPVRGSA